jgi:SpoIID/LytB domain protein
MLAKLTDLRVRQRGPSGRASEMDIEYSDAAGSTHRIIIRSEYRIREALHEKFLFSSAFKVETDRDEAGELSRIRLVGAGWGHGAGLCQIGALGMAIKGYACREIVRHYFEGVDLRALY